MRSPFLWALLTGLLGCGGKVVFVDGDGDDAASDGGRGAQGGAAATQDNAWHPDCPGYFPGSLCPSQCPIFVDPGDEHPPGRVYCTETCVEATPTGCAVGAVCDDDRCMLGYCNTGVLTCAKETACQGVAEVCVPSTLNADTCAPSVDDTCESPCTIPFGLPDGSTLCTSRCKIFGPGGDEPCTFGFSCRDDLPPVSEYYDYLFPCIPNCFTDDDCPGGLTCDELGRCSAP